MVFFFKYKSSFLTERGIFGKGRTTKKTNHIEWLSYQILNDLLDSSHHQDEEQWHQCGPATSGRHVWDLLKETQEGKITSNLGNFFPPANTLQFLGTFMIQKKHCSVSHRPGGGGVQWCIHNMSDSSYHIISSYHTDTSTPQVSDCTHQFASPLLLLSPQCLLCCCFF